MTKGYGDFEIFTPTESQYVQPGEFEAVQRGQALQKATYLSQMDQFYEGLDETRRQFERSMEFQEKTLTEGARQFDVGMGLEGRKLDIQEEQIDIQEEQFKKGLEFQYFEQAEKAREFDEMLGFEFGKQEFAEEAWIADYLENIRQFDVESSLKKKELELATRAQQHEEDNDLLGSILDIGTFVAKIF